MSRTLRFEQAEPRAMLSVTPSFSGGDLVFSGNGDNDTITVAVNGSGNVTLNGNEFLGGVAASAVYTFYVDGGGGNDIINLTGVLPSQFTGLVDIGWVNVAGGAGDDTIYGSPFADSINGGDGNDHLYGYGGSDALFGGSGNDHFYFSGSSNLGSDTIFEAANVDTDYIWFDGLAAGATMDLNIAGSFQTVAPGLLKLALSDATGIEVLRGTNHDDTLKGNSRSNHIYGFAGDDWLEGRGGNDNYYYDHYTFDHGHDTIKEDSGGGNDHLNFYSFVQTDNGQYTGVTIDLAEDDVQEVGTATISGVTTTRLELTLVNPEQIEYVTGSNAADTIYGNSANNIVTGYAGDDTIFGRGGNDYLNGGDGHDVLSGEAGNDSLIGGAGDDTYLFDPTSGSLGSDSITETADLDSDTLDFSAFTTDITFSLASTSAQPVGGSLTLTLSNATGVENIIGGSGNDELTGNSRDNLLAGGDGNDILYGLDGNDILTGEDGDDDIYAGDGGDLLFGGDGDDTLTATGGDDLLDGGAGTNTLDGEVWNDPPAVGVIFHGGFGAFVGFFDVAVSGESFIVNLTVTAYDDSDDTMTFEIVEDSGLDVTLSQTGDQTAIAYLTIHDADAVGAYRISVRATDSGGQSGEGSYYLSVRDSASGEPDALNWPPAAWDAWYAVPSTNTLEVEQSFGLVDDYTRDQNFDVPLEISNYTEPSHAEDFSIEPDGSFTYTPEEGFSGIDSFTFQVTDGSEQSNTAKVELPKPNIEAKKILHSKPNGEHLTEAEEEDIGAFVPLNVDDDDDSGTLDALDENFGDGENDLLPVELKAMPRGRYSLSYPANLRVYVTKLTHAKKSDVELKSGQWFDATGGRTVYVEGISTGTGTLTLNWTDGQHTAADAVKITVFTWSGPRNVPETSTYTYAAEGGAVGAGKSKWVAGATGSTLVSSDENIENGADKAKFKWDEGPIIGYAAYQAGPGYVWDIDVNVVKVTVEAPDGEEAITVDEDAPIDGGEGQATPDDAYSKIVDFQTAGDVAAKWGAKVTLEGPKGGRGVDMIETGFVQIITDFNVEGTYVNGSKLVRDVSSVLPLTDCPVDGYPWYGTNPSAKMICVRTPGLSTCIDTIRASDSPKLTIPLTLDKGTSVEAGDVLLTHTEIQITFVLAVCSRATSGVLSDDLVDGVDVPTRMAYTYWVIDSSGDVGGGPNYAWTATGPAALSTLGHWVDLNDGSRPPLQDPRRIASIEINNTPFSSP